MADPITIQNTIIAEVDSSVVITLDGETLEDTRLHRGEDGEIYVDAMPIFETLGNDVEFDAETKALIVRRSQDGVVMELYTDTGIVKANGRALGSLDVFGSVSPAEMLLTPNAVAVLSGVSGDFDKENNRIDFELDPRLRTTTDFDLIVNGAPIGSITPSPKSVGPVLLLPLRPIAEQLGHVVEIVDGGAAVRVERAQDAAVFTLNLDTGLVSLYGNPIGISDDVSYIDPVDLLLPVSAFEALTGTHVSAGDNGEVLIDLDRRLIDTVGPDGTVAEVAADTPFTVEYAAFQLGPQSVNKVEVAAHGGTFSGRLRAELGELPGDVAELEPDWLSVDFQHISGVRGSVGDNSADLRELDGVGTRRFRGVRLQTDADEGKWAFAAGTPAADRRRISDDQTRYNFAGLVAGARYSANEGWEAGLSARHDPVTDDQMAVLSAISGRLGRKVGKPVEWDASGSVGVFNGPNRANAIDAQANANLRRKFDNGLRLDVSADYTGGEFTRNLLRAEDLRKLNALQEGIDLDDEENRRIPDIRTVEADTASVGIRLSGYTAQAYGTLEGVSASIDLRRDQTGLVTGTDVGGSVNSASLSVGARIAPLDLSVNASVSAFEASSIDPEAATRGTAAQIDLYREIDYVTARARAEVREDDVNDRQTTASLTLTAQNLKVPLPKAASVSLRPTASAALRDEEWNLRGGMFANVDSGDWFGRKTRVQASLGILQSASGRAGSRTNRFLNVSVARDVRIGRNMAVGLGYRADLRGDHQLGLLLQGRYDFAPQRRLQKTADSSGLLQGSAFIDENGDGIRQDGERGAGGVIVRVQGTPHALRTDKAGAFTIQNVRRGLYQVGVDGRSLPLGYGMTGGETKSVTIKTGHVTTLDLPIQRFGQIRGSVYIDADASGAFERGEARPEGVTLELVDADGEVQAVTGTTAFGQFAFDTLPIDSYTIRTKTNENSDLTADAEVNLADAEQGMIRMKLALRDPETVRVVDTDGLDPDPPEPPDPPKAADRSEGLPP